MKYRISVNLAADTISVFNENGDCVKYFTKASALDEAKAWVAAKTNEQPVITVTHPDTPMKITHANGYLNSNREVDFCQAIREECEYHEDQHVVTARLLETLHAKGILTKEDLGTILNLDIVEITP